MNPYTLIFTLGADYRWLTNLFRGSYIPVGASDEAFKINPFSLAATPENFEFLHAFVKLLRESDAPRMDDAEQKDLFDAVRSIYVLEPEQRRLLTLSNMVSRSTGNHLRRWVEGGQYGKWFDNVDDTVSYARFQCINFEGMERLGVVLEPLLFYLLHRASEVIHDPALATSLKIAVVDEAWLFFKHPVTQAYIVAAMRTWRKNNAAMILSTQSLRDLAGAEVLRPVVESCPTKLLLANPNLESTLYGEVLQLSATEQERVRRLVPKKQFLLKREGFSKVLNLNVDPRSYWLFTTNPYESKRREEIVERVGLEAGLKTLSGGLNE